MKNLIVIVALVLISNLALSNESVQLKLDNVKVYLSGAEISHSAKIKLKAGTNDIILENIANNISPNSINATLSTNAIMMSVAEKYDYLNPKEKSNDVKKLEDSIEILGVKIAEANNEIQSLDAEADFLNVNKIITGKDKAMTLLELKAISAYYAERTLEIKNIKLKINDKIKVYQIRFKQLQSQLAEINTRNTKSIHQIALTISSPTNQTIDLGIKYFVNEAGWYPFYDIRVKDISTPIEFYHKANVWQNTGMDWDNVNLTISTRNPTISGDMPDVNPVFLDFADAYKPRQDYVGSINSVSNASVEVLKGGFAAEYGNAMGGFVNRGSRDKESQIRIDGVDVGNQFSNSYGTMGKEYFPMMSAFATAITTTISVEYKTDLTYTIPTDNKPHIVDLKSSEIKGNFEYYTAPKYKLESYLVARISDWANNELLPGEANVYFENSYTGKSELQPNISEDTLDLSLGVDKNIIVTRDIVKDFTETKFLSSDIERFFAYKITVKNTKKTKIKIVIEDQIPVSKNEDIKVKLLESSEAKPDAETGIVKWIVEIEPGKSVEKLLKFSVRHPSSKKVGNF